MGIGEILDKCIGCRSSLTLESCYVAQILSRLRILLPEPSEITTMCHYASIVDLEFFILLPQNTWREGTEHLRGVLCPSFGEGTISSNLPSTHQRASLELRPRNTSPESYELRRKF